MIPDREDDNIPVYVAERMRVQPKKSDVTEGYIGRYEFAALLGVHPSTIYKWDRKLAILCPAYFADRLGSRQPLSQYQQWCMRKLQTILHSPVEGKPLSWKSVSKIVEKNPYLFSYDSFLAERKELHQRSSLSA